MQALTTTDHLREGVVARYTEAKGFKLAVCVDFSNDSRPHVRFYNATAAKWTSPVLVHRAHLGTLGAIEIEGPSRQHRVLSGALEALRGTPALDLRSEHIACLVMPHFAMEQCLLKWANQLEAYRDKPGNVGPFIAAELRRRLERPALHDAELRNMEQRLLEWAEQLEAAGGVGPFIAAELRNRMNCRAEAQVAL